VHGAGLFTNGLPTTDWKPVCKCGLSGERGEVVSVTEGSTIERTTAGAAFFVGYWQDEENAGDVAQGFA
jgi:hypothetical protein